MSQARPFPIPSEIAKVLTSPPNAVRPAPAQKRKPVPETFGADELFNGEYPDPVGIIDRLLYQGITILQGAPKEGKSYFALQASLDMVNGWPFMSYFPVTAPKSVLYVALEDTKSRTARRMKQVGEYTDRLSELRFIYSLDPWPANVTQLDDILTERHADVVIIDTLLGLLSGGKKASTDIVKADYDVLNLLRDLSEKHKSAIWVLSHTKKHSAGLSDTDSGIGSTGISAGVDALLTLRRLSGGTTMLSVLGREVERAEYELQFDIAKHNGWKMLASGSEAGLTAERRDIFELLKQRGPMAPKAIAEDLGKKGPAIRRLLMKLAQQGVLRVNPAGQYLISQEAL